MSLTKQPEMKRALAALEWINKKRCVFMGKDTSKPIRFKTVQKNTKLAEFAAEENKEIILEEQKQID